MELTARLNAAVSQISVWTVQNPTATRVVVLVAPVVLAAIWALATHQPIYACPVPSGCGGGDGPG